MRKEDQWGSFLWMSRRPLLSAPESRALPSPHIFSSSSTAPWMHLAGGRCGARKRSCCPPWSCSQRRHRYRSGGGFAAPGALAREVWLGSLASPPREQRARLSLVTSVSFSCSTLPHLPLCHKDVLGGKNVSYFYINTYVLPTFSS